MNLIHHFISVLYVCEFTCIGCMFYVHIRIILSQQCIYYMVMSSVMTRFVITMT